MAFPTTKLLIIFVTSFLALNSFPSAKAADLIDDVCAHVPADQEFCKVAYRGDPRTATADLTTLAQVGIDLAESRLHSAITAAVSLQKTAAATDGKLKGILDSCLDDYNDSGDSLKDCSAALKEKDYASLNIRASAALDGAAECNTAFTAPPTVQPDSVKQSNMEISTLCSSIAYLANKLQGKVSA